MRRLRMCSARRRLRVLRRLLHEECAIDHLGSLREKQRRSLRLVGLLWLRLLVLRHEEAVGVVRSCLLLVLLTMRRGYAPGHCNECTGRKP